jgi:hypothetical protein
VAASAWRRRCSRGGAGRPAGSCPARRARAQPAQLGRVAAVWRLGVKAQALPAGEMEGVDGCGRPADRAAPAGVEAVEGRVARRRRRDPREVSVGEVARLASVWWRAWTIAVRVRAPVPAHPASPPRSSPEHPRSEPHEELAPVQCAWATSRLRPISAVRGRSWRSDHPASVLTWAPSRAGRARTPRRAPPSSPAGSSARAGAARRSGQEGQVATERPDGSSATPRPG